MEGPFAAAPPPSVSATTSPIHLPIRFANREETEMPYSPNTTGSAEPVVIGW